MKALLLLPLLLCGCVVARPYARETTITTNGVVTTREIGLTSFAIWPGTISIEKQRASLGKTMNLGQVNFEAETGGTNVVESLRHIDSILRTVAGH